MTTRTLILDAENEGLVGTLNESERAVSDYAATTEEMLGKQDPRRVSRFGEALKSLRNTFSGLRRTNRRANLALAEGVNQSTEFAFAVGQSVPAFRQYGTAIAAAGNNAFVLTSALGPLGIGIAALTGALPFLIGALLDTGEAAEETAGKEDRLTRSIDATTKAIQDQIEQQRVLIRVRTGQATEAEAAERVTRLIEEQTGLLERQGEFTGRAAVAARNRVASLAGEIDVAQQALETARQRNAVETARIALANVLDDLSKESLRDREAAIDLAIQQGALEASQRDAALEALQNRRDEQRGRGGADPEAEARKARRAADREFARFLDGLIAETTAALEPVEQMLDALRAQEDAIAKTTQAELLRTEAEKRADAEERAARALAAQRDFQLGVTDKQLLAGNEDIVQQLQDQLGLTAEIAQQEFLRIAAAERLKEAHEEARAIVDAGLASAVSMGDQLATILEETQTAQAGINALQGAFSNAFREAISGEKSFREALKESLKVQLANFATQQAFEGIALIAEGIALSISNPPEAATKFAGGGVKLAIAAAAGGAAAAIPRPSGGGGGGGSPTPQRQDSGGGGGGNTFVVQINSPTDPAIIGRQRAATDRAFRNRFNR